MNQTAAPLWSNGEHPGPIPAAIEKLGLPAPDFSWFEPKPGSALDTQGRQIAELAAPRLHPILRRGPLRLPEGLQIDEARLFWRDGALHLIIRPEGVSWFFWTQRNALAPRGAQCQPVPEGAMDQPRPVLLQRRAADGISRFGLPLDDELGKIELETLALLSNGAVFGWTLREKR